MPPWSGDKLKSVPRPSGFAIRQSLTCSVKGEEPKLPVPRPSGLSACQSLTCCVKGEEPKLPVPRPSGLSACQSLTCCVKGAASCSCTNWLTALPCGSLFWTSLAAIFAVVCEVSPAVVLCCAWAKALTCAPIPSRGCCCSHCRTPCINGDCCPDSALPNPRG